MNDRFKFRVWSKQSNSYIKDKMFYIDRFGGLFKYEKSKSTVYINADSPYVMCLCGDRYVCEQCTGLRDKNGKLIYEGDIVRESPYNKYFEYADYVVSWKDGAYTNEKCLCMKNKETGEIKDCSKGGYCFSKHIHQEEADDFEVIGNIHENANLLEVDDD